VTVAVLAGGDTPTVCDDVLATESIFFVVAHVKVVACLCIAATIQGAVRQTGVGAVGSATGGGAFVTGCVAGVALEELGVARQHHVLRFAVAGAVERPVHTLPWLLLLLLLLLLLVCSSVARGA
jgi:hypothetical protein